MGQKRQGMNWITKSKRASIYIRDNMECVFCGCNIFYGDTTLTLDHLTPKSCGGSNHQTNLVTCCAACNTAKSTMFWQEFCGVVAAIQEINPQDLIGHVMVQSSKPLPVAEAKRFLEAGSWRDALIRATKEAKKI